MRPQFQLLFVLSFFGCALTANDDKYYATETINICSENDLSPKTAANLRYWLSSCQIFKGDLDLGFIDMESADFTNLIEIHGSLRVIGTEFKKLPNFFNLRRILSKKIGLIIMNNSLLVGIDGITHGNTHIIAPQAFIIENNERLNLDLYSHDIAKKQDLISYQLAAPGTIVTFSQGLTLYVGIMIFLITAAVFLYLATLGSVNVYLVPGYHSI